MALLSFLVQVKKQTHIINIIQKRETSSPISLERRWKNPILSVCLSLSLSLSTILCRVCQFQIFSDQQLSPRHAPPPHPPPLRSFRPASNQIRASQAAEFFLGNIDAISETFFYCYCRKTRSRRVERDSRRGNSRLMNATTAPPPPPTTTTKIKISFLPSFHLFPFPQRWNTKN